MILAQLTKGTKLTFISNVSKPANMADEDTVKLSQEEDLHMSFDEEKREVTSAVLIPNQKIYRNAEFFNKTLGINDDGYIFCTAEDIMDMALEYINNNPRINLNHQDVVENGEVLIMENWFITTENDKAYDMGFSKEKYPQRTWMQTHKFMDLNLWEDCKAGKYNGFSIQGNPVLKMISSTLNMMDEKNENEVVNLILGVVKESLKENK